MEVPASSVGLDSTRYHNYEVIPAIPQRRLLALDPRTGRMLWEAGAKERPLSFLDHLSFSTEPLAMDGRVYLAGAVFEGIPTAFVVALDGEDGSLIWKRRICAGSQELNMFGRPIREYCGSPISAVGDYLGGAIAPGVGIAAQALFERTAKLPRVELTRPPSVIGRNTPHSMQAGLLFGYVGLVEGMVVRFRAELGPEMKVVATGGLAPLIAAETDVIDVVDPWLTLEGLRLIWGLNQEQRLSSKE